MTPTAAALHAYLEAGDPQNRRAAAIALYGVAASTQVLSVPAHQVPALLAVAEPVLAYPRLGPPWAFTCETSPRAGEGHRRPGDSPFSAEAHAALAQALRYLLRGGLSEAAS